VTWVEGVIHALYPEPDQAALPAETLGS